jgi:hypothetical protein
MNHVETLQKYIFTDNQVEMKSGLWNAFVLRHPILLKKEDTIKPKSHFDNFHFSSRCFTMHKKNQDSLLWCFFILKEDVQSYLQRRPNEKTIVAEKQMKIKEVERKPLYMTKIKAKQIKCTWSHLEKQWMQESKIDLTTCLAMCAIEGITVWVLFENKTYFIQEAEETQGQETQGQETQGQKNPKAIWVFKNGLYGCVSELSKEDQDVVVSSWLKRETAESTLKAFSHYKRADLLSLAEKVNLDEPFQTKSLTNKVLFEKISQKID